MFEPDTKSIEHKHTLSPQRRLILADTEGRRGHRGGAGDASPPPDLKRCWHGTWFHWKSSPKYFCTAHYLITTRVRFTVTVECHAVMSLLFTHVPSFACRSGLRKSRADCSTVGLHCATMAWQQICKGSLYITEQAFCCMILLNAHILAVNAARQWHADSGKPRIFILCEKKHEWICSNASTSLKNPLSVRVWRMCLSVKLRLCRLLFMQY